MNETIELLQIGMVTKYIAHHEQEPQSRNYFQLSVEGISLHKNPTS